MSDKGAAGREASPEAVRSLGRRAGWLIALAASGVIANLAATSSYLAGYRVDGESDGTLFGSLLAVFGALTQLAGLLLLFAEAIVFFFWLHRAVACAHALVPPPHALAVTPGWAVVAYFIPFVNLARPYQHMSQLSIAADPFAVPEPPLPPPEPAPVGDYRAGGRRPPADAPVRWPETAPVGLWWGVSLAANVALNVSGRVDDGGSIVHPISWLVMAAASALLVLVVRSISLRLREIARRRAVPLPPRPYYG